MADTQDDPRQPLFVVHGTGGRLELWEDQLRLRKYSIINSLINLFGFGFGKVSKSIGLRQISSVTIVQPMLFPNFITFTYPGSPVSTGSLLQDALAENALLMNFFDNRGFFELKDRMDALCHDADDLVG